MCTRLISFLLCATLWVTVEGDCTIEPISSNNFVIQPWSNLHIEVDNDSGTPTATLDNYNEAQHSRFFFTTQFHSCGGTDIFVSLKSHEVINGNRFYLANSVVRGGVDLVDLVVDNGGAFVNSQDVRLFKYNGGVTADLTSLESKRVFVSRGPPAAVILLSPEVFWSTWPFITRVSSISSHTTTLQTSFQINNRRTNVAASFTSQRSLRLLSTASASFRRLTSRELDFEMVGWRLYKRFNSRGDIITGQAVILKNPHEDMFVAADVNDGIVRLPRRACLRQRLYNYHHRSYYYRYRCLQFQRVQYKHYSDAARSRGSTFVASTLRNQTSVDERFFEVLHQHDGTVRLRSMLHPGAYLAVLKLNDHQFQLILSELKWVGYNFVSFDFQASIPSLADKGVTMVPRLPCDSTTRTVHRSQLSLFKCA